MTVSGFTMMRTSPQWDQIRPQGCPEEPVEGVQRRTRSFPLEHGDLLPKGENLQRSVAPTAEEDADGSQE